MHREPMSYRSHRPGAAHSPGASSGWEVISSRGRDLPFPAVTMPGFSGFAEPALLCPLGALLCTCTRAVDRSASARLRHLPRRLPPAPSPPPPRVSCIPSASGPSTALAMAARTLGCLPRE